MLPRKGGWLSEALLGLSQAAEKTPRHPKPRTPEPRRTLAACVSQGPCERRVPTQHPERFTAQGGEPDQLLPGSRHAMFWLPVKGPVYWKHTSFLMFGFLSLFSPFSFSQSALPRAFKKDMELTSCLRVTGKGAHRPEFLLVAGGAPPPVGRSPRDRRADPRSSLSSATWGLWGHRQARPLSRSQ